MTEERKNQQPQDDRSQYEAPRVMRLGDAEGGVGFSVCPSGSGAQGCQSSGTGATVGCDNTGSTPG
jgi:hypothetical protein